MKKQLAGRSSLLLTALALVSVLPLGCASQPAADTVQTGPASPGKPTAGQMPPSLPTKNTGPKSPEEIQAFAKSHGYGNVTVKK